MTRRFACILAFLLLAASLHAEDGGMLQKILGVARPEGTRVELDAVPDFLQRIFFPAVPGAENFFRVHGKTIDVIEAPAGFEVSRQDGGLTIKAPAGEAHGYLRARVGDRELTLTVVNLVPYERMHAGILEGYRIGEYAMFPMRGLASYRRPKGFMRLTEANRELWVSDHYRLQDFQCKLDGSSKFLILRTEALIKLELMQNILERKGVRFDRFTIMSGYRTPFYNARIGNETGKSRHLYGDAMDVYIDQNRDGLMDDVNHDGRVDTEDARFLLQIAAAIDLSQDWGWLKGGAGVYHANAAHGPYLHVDARGYVARWGV